MLGSRSRTRLSGTLPLLVTEAGLVTAIEALTQIVVLVRLKVGRGRDAVEVKDGTELQRHRSGGLRRVWADDLSHKQLADGVVVPPHAAEDPALFPVGKQAVVVRQLQ